jgi:general secretion pathway protein G
MFRSVQKNPGMTFVKPAFVREAGFTLIELLVVISIIGLLATLVTANLNAARSRSRDAVRKADLKNIQTSLRLYYNDTGSYPSSISFGSSFESDTASYMDKVPNDPLYQSDNSSSPQYVYIYDSNTDTFTLSACLENTSDTNCKSLSVTGLTCSSNCVYQIKP